MKFPLVKPPSLPDKIFSDILLVSELGSATAISCAAPIAKQYGLSSAALSKARVFLRQMLPYALDTQRLTGIPASVTLAQAGIESGWGKHAPGNNFFGIKGKGPAGSQWLMTTEFRSGRNVRVRAEFRRYHSPLESFLDHAKVISEGRYLRHAMRHTQSARDFIQALQSGKYKYATDPNYGEKIMEIIRRHHLEKHDHVPKKNSSFTFPRRN